MTGMRRSLVPSCLGLVGALACLLWGQVESLGAQSAPTYRIVSSSDRAARLDQMFTEPQLALLEKLNRADVAHLARLREIVVPDSWDDNDLLYSGLPIRYAPGAHEPTFLIVYLPGQLFGAYEYGTLVHWGPISSGQQSSPTPSGVFSLNWRSTGRASTVNPDWFMRWYFNFSNAVGLALHAYALPGRPASHGCVRLLDRDARWLFAWGRPSIADSSGPRVRPGTPVFIVGEYDFDAPPPWHSPIWLSQPLALPPPDTAGMPR